MRSQLVEMSPDLSRSFARFVASGRGRLGLLSEQELAEKFFASVLPLWPAQVGFMHLEHDMRGVVDGRADLAELVTKGLLFCGAASLCGSGGA